MTNLVDVKDMSFAYGRKVIFDSLSLTVDSKCHLVSVIGPDGSGKSTLLKLLAGLLKADRGHILIDGCSVFRAKSQGGMTIGYMSQNLNLYKELSVLENLKLFGSLKDAGGCDEYYRSLIDKVGLGAFTHYASSSLSGGMRQKLALACAMASNPDILILDEPTVGVDPYSRAQLWELIHNYIQEHNAWCIFSSLYLEESEHCDCTLLLKDFKILSQGRAADIKMQAQNQVYSLHFEKGSYLDISRLLSVAVYKRRSPVILDALPRLGCIDILAGDCVTKDKLKEYIDSLLYEHNLLCTYTIKRRGALLEDAYILLTQENDQKERSLDIYGYNQCSMNGTKSRDYCSDRDGEKRDDSVIKICDVVKRFGDFVAVEKSSFNVKKGEIFGLLGPNGAGKTTTFRMICALLNPSSGQILIENLNLARSKSLVRARIGYVAQKFSLYSNLTVLENMRYFAQSYGLFGKRLDERIASLSSVFALNDFFNTRASQLPFGVQRQLSMCCALMHRPSILFLDEATSGADPLARRSFFAIINALALQGTSIIVTTHFMEEAEYCDRFLIQDKGRIVLLGRADEICVAEDGSRISVEETFLNAVAKSRGEYVS